MMHFVRTFSNIRAQGVRFIVIEKVRNYGKTVFINNMFENGCWGVASLTSPLDPPLIIASWFGGILSLIMVWKGLNPLSPLIRQYVMQKHCGFARFNQL